MKAIVVREFGPPDVLKLEDVPDPVAGAGQAVIDVRAVGVNPYESYMRTGTYPLKPTLPYTPGADAAGVVESVGEGVTRFKPGDRVYIIGTVTGAYAQKVLCEERHVCPLPERISFAQGAGLNVPFGTAYRALFDRGQLRAGETVLVHGATGGVGTAAVQLALNRGAIVIGTGGTDKGRELLRSLGVTHVVDHKSPGYLDEIRTITAGKGPDVILEMLANVNLQKDLDLIAKFGRIVVIGNRGTIEINPRATMAKEAIITGLTMWGRGEEPIFEAHAEIGAGLRNGTLNPIVGTEMRLGDAPQAHVKVMEAGAIGKIVLIP